MTAEEIAVWALLAAAAVIVLACSVGVVVATGVYPRLHYTAPAAVLAPIPVTAAVLLEEGVSSSSVKAILIALTLLVTNPILVHATARAEWMRKEEEKEA